MRQLARRLPEGDVPPLKNTHANAMVTFLDQGEAVHSELIESVRTVARGIRSKAMVRRADRPWELVIERRQDDLLLSLIWGGGEVVVLDQPIDWAFLSQTLRLERDEIWYSSEETAPDSFVEVQVDAPREAPLGFAASFALRDRWASESREVERADLHALLFRGVLALEVRSRRVELGGGFPFIFAEDLVGSVAKLLGSWERGISEETCVLLEEAKLRLLLKGDTVALVLAHPQGTFTFPALSIEDLVGATLDFARGVVRAVLRREPAQAANLRLSSFQRRSRELAEALTEVSKDDTRTNPSPEVYRSYLSDRPFEAAKPQWNRLRYGQKWRAIVPGINLKGTFLCGDRFIVDGRMETYGLERATGKAVWRVATAPAVSLPSPVGLARLGYDGTLSVYDLANGDLKGRAEVCRRFDSVPSAAVVQAPGLPPMMLVLEGRSHLLALDLPTGQARWRMPWNGGAVRTKRAGRLLVLGGGDTALVAVDLATGSIVWRQRNRLKFSTTPALVRDSLIAIAGGSHALAELVNLDACSGEARWRVNIDEGPCSIEGGPLASEHAIVCALRTRRGLRLVGFDPAVGTKLWDTNAPVAPFGTSWLVVDDLVIGNTPGGELVAVEMKTGRVRYRQLLGAVIDSDVPRRLEPVLRSGALFVPHADVHVFRPSDGVELGRIGPCHAIPDLLRVDEDSNVYIAEESGHVAAFGVGPRLTLVK